jgi:hypothetical protein
MAAHPADFGFGRLAMVELASMNHNSEMVFIAGTEDGLVQAMVAWSQIRCLLYFSEMFLAYT